jgi:hypothetical protein
MHMVNCIRESKPNPNFNTLESERLQHQPPSAGGGAACVIAQQYSSATFASPIFHSRKEKLGSRFKNVAISNFFIF